jgi:hypothetical protein
MYPNKRLITEKLPYGEKVKLGEKRIIHAIPIPYTAWPYTTESKNREKRLVKAVDEERIG